MKASWILPAAVVVSAAYTTNPPKNPSVTVNGTTFEGLVRNGVDAFLGIRFGQDTGGVARFKAPVPYVYPSSPAVVAATDAGPMCPQVRIDEGDPRSEDCLRLNVVRPRGTQPGAKHAVMVWIYGGSFWVGSKDDIFYQPDGAVLESVRAGEPIVHVAINYRLGAFGFAQDKVLDAEGSTNAGLRDQRLGLEWVRDNIARFGGDPSRVTIYGQSSGGLSVGLQLLAHGGESTKPAPFERGIMQSESAMEIGLSKGDYTRAAMQRLAEYTHCTADTVACLRKLSMKDLLNATVETYLDGPANNIGDIWLPQVDGDFLPDEPMKLIREGRFHKRDAIFGWTEEDLDVAVPDDVATANDTRRAITGLLPFVSQATVDGLLALYPVSEFVTSDPDAAPAEFYRAGRVITDLIMVCPAAFFSRYLSAASPDTSNYMYMWNQTTLSLPVVRVAHTSELPYVFGNLSHPDIFGGNGKVTPDDEALMVRATRGWTAFAATGKPSGIRGAFAKWKGAYAKGDGKDAQMYVVGGPGEGMLDYASYEDRRTRCGYIEEHIKMD
ncbi:hypothetical protein V2A60_008458 [Cordyceps javanica]|uniref:Carboxylic ester hydrolase n=1 Tax=Cordyceps javanica TaxID=43265 RepID=A0A545UKM6_9HYPO|nr:lipase [Cordyceps javanica]TQW01464.1 lipase [Cordyceps javanica]